MYDDGIDEDGKITCSVCKGRFYPEDTQSEFCPLCGGEY